MSNTGSVEVRFSVYEGLYVYKDIFKYSECFLTRSQSNQLSHCHPPRHTIHQQNEAVTANENGSFPPAAFFGSGSTNQRRLASAPDPVSGWAQPITEAPAHLMHWCLLAGTVGRLALVRSPTQVLWIQAIILTGGQSDASSRYQTHVAWQTLSVCILCVCSMYVDVCIYGTLLPLSHNALLPYQQASLTRSWLHPLLETQQWALCCPLKELEASAIKRD